MNNECSQQKTIFREDEKPISWPMDCPSLSSGNMRQD
jgi:hypothetical protein